MGIDTVLRSKLVTGMTLGFHAAGDTLLLICHRLIGLEEMDRIVVIDDGRVVESGTYAELMEQKGYFYEMKQIERQMVG
jgi:ATP-binding cassette subfamily C protein CydC